MYQDKVPTGTYESKGRFKISGVFQLYQWMDDNKLYLPNDVDIVFAGCRPNAYTNITTVSRTSIFPSTGPKGHTSRYTGLIHERCLTLISQVLGSPALSQNLEQFFTSLDMVERDLGIGELPWTEAARHLNSHLEYQKKQNALGAFMHLDPWRDLELENAIFQAHSARQSGHEIQMYSAPVPSATPLALPIDIQMLIIDRLDQPTDLQNAMVAFGWSFPDVYWKGRIPKDIIFEYESIYSVDIDWLAFFYWVKALLPVSQGLRKRQFVVNFLEFVKPVYDREVEAKMLVY